MNKPKTARPGLLRLLAWGAFACWLAAWFLPVIEGNSGWAAFRAALGGPFQDGSPVSGSEAVPQVLSALTNLVFVVLFAHWKLERVTKPAMFFKVSLACLLLNLYWLVQMLRAGDLTTLLIGYYVWLVAFAMLATVGALNVVSIRRTSKKPTAGRPA